MSDSSSANAVRTAFETLNRGRLAEIADKLGLTVADRRSSAAYVAAIAKAPKVDGALGVLSRDELKSMCEALGVDSSGRDKDPIIARLVARFGDGAAPKADGFALMPTEAKKPRPKQTTMDMKPGPKVRQKTDGPVGDYRHEDTRKNNPPAGLIDLDKPPAKPVQTYSYDPHLDPQLIWSGKAEHTSFDVDTVSLHIHERISAQAILRAAKREEAQRSLFAETELPDSKAIDFYAHDVGWANRLVLGDSLLVMNSLLEREQMAGKVQCIYMDPPYGVQFSSNFQPAVSRRMVKDDDTSLTREPEQIQAYRDTWTLGIHSYLTYLRDRLQVARELLGNSGSVFVQIGQENVHLVRVLLDEVFGRDNFVSLISYRTSVPLTSSGLPSVDDYILWYARDRTALKMHPLFVARETGDKSRFTNVELSGGTRRGITANERARPDTLPEGSRVFTVLDLASSGYTQSCTFEFEYNGKKYRTSSGKSWKTTRDGMERLARVGRISDTGDTIRYVLYLDDFPVMKLTNSWSDTTGELGKTYVVQTHTNVIERCLLMTTDPGDLVLDPTCGSGTTAFVAEQWGRRWITCDTSRVALAIARQRVLTARYPYYSLRSDRVRDGFVYKTVPHITLGSIAQNPKLDACKTQEERERLIRESADQEVLYDQPVEDKSKVRVSGPFTVEAIPVAAMEDPTAPQVEQLPPEARDDDIARGRGHDAGRIADLGGDYIGHMIDLFKKSGGVHFKGGKNLPLTTIRPVRTPHEYLHAESETGIEGDGRKVAISFGPRHGPVTPKQVLDAIQQTRGYDLVLFVGFACDPEAGRMIEQGAQGREFQFVHAAPDILVQDLLKTSKATKLFTVFGLPDVKIKKEKDGQVAVTLAGVDLYDPITSETHHDDGDSVAAWFLDHDYDGRTFLVCQAFFPGGKVKNPWERLQKALKGTIDEDKFESLRGTTSIPFKPGKRVAVKVIDDRGNEVVKVVAAS
jgi:adenine-specific DNA-methyltransferase